MGKGKDLPAIDFHAAVAKRDPALAERLIREGIATPASPAVVTELPSVAAPIAPPVVAPTAIEVANEVVPRERHRRRRGLVPRSNGREAGRITVYVPPELALRFKQHCFERDQTMTDVAGELLIEALKKRLSL
jgi:hypothetical protein